MDPLDEFLQHFVRGYLLSDLQEMLKIGTELHRVESKDGHCAYPIVMTLMAGIEVLGVLAGHKEPYTFQDENEKWKTVDGQKQFTRYWTKYLYPKDQRPKWNGVGSDIYQLVRNGLDHTFVAKLPIKVSRQQPKKHLLATPDRSVVNIDADQLAADFADSYKRFAADVARTSETEKPNRHTATDRLRELMENMARATAASARSLENLDVDPSVAEVPGTSSFGAVPGASGMQLTASYVPTTFFNPGLWGKSPY
jgi:hypothetical protein